MTCIFCKKNGQKRSILREIRAQTFYYPLYGVATAYSTNENPSTDKLSRAINYSGRDFADAPRGRAHQVERWQQAQSQLLLTPDLGWVEASEELYDVVV